MESGKLSIPFAVREFGIPQDLNHLLERRCHDHRVVIAVKNAVEDLEENGEALSRLGTNHNRRTNLRELVNECLSLLNSAGIVESENTEDITSLKGGSRLLDELHNTIFLSKKGHIHLHYLDFGEGLASLDVRAVLDRVLDKLSGARSAELSRVVLLLKEAGLGVDR